MFIDTHCHLQDEAFVDKVEEIVNNAKSNDVNLLVCASYDKKSSIDAVEISNKFNNVYAVIGVHPENCEEYNSEVENTLIELAKDKKVKAIGEIGLDYHYTKENKEIQKEVFIKQILLAEKLNLPIVIHTRDAIGDTIDIIREYKDHLKNGGIFHCFNASVPVLEEINKYGFYVSYGGAITFNNASKLREIVKATSMDFILTETDCPYMAPVPLRGTVNEPKNIKLVAEKIAEIKGVSLDEVERKIEENTKKIFKL